MVTVFLSILNQMEFHLVQNRKENCHHDHIPFNVRGIGNIVFSVYGEKIRVTTLFYFPVADIDRLQACKNIFLIAWHFLIDIFQPAQYARQRFSSICSNFPNISNESLVKYLGQIYQNKPYFKYKKYYIIYKNQFLGEKL